MFDNISEPLGQQTEFLLKAVANRLSGREDCRKVCYRVIIDHNGVRMNPLIYVWPNRYRRREEDKLDIISYIHKYKMPNAELTGFVFGVYEYELSYDGRRRKWRKAE